MVAEKPSIATAIADALQKHRPHQGSSENKGKPRGSLPVHSFQGTFNNEQVMFRITSVAGHVFSTDFPPQFQVRNT